MRKCDRIFLLLAIYCILAIRWAAVASEKGQNGAGNVALNLKDKSKMGNPKEVDSISGADFQEKRDVYGGPTLPSDAETTQRAIILDNNVKGIRELPELSRDQAGLLETMHTISPEDKLYKHFFKDKYDNIIPRHRRSFQVSDVNVKNDDFQIPQESMSRPDNSNDLDSSYLTDEENEREIEYEPVRRRNTEKSAEDSDFSFESDDDKFQSDILADDQAEEEVKEGNEERNKRNMLLHNSINEERFMDDYSNPDYVYKVEKSENSSVKYEDGNVPIRQARNGEMASDDYDTEDDGELEENNDHITESNRWEEGDLNVNTIRKKRQGKKITKLTKAKPIKKSQMEEIANKIGKTLRKKVTNKQLLKELKDTKNAASRSAAPTANVNKYLKRIMKNIAGSLNTTVSTKEFAKEVEDTMKAVAGIPPAPVKNSTAGANKDLKQIVKKIAGSIYATVSTKQFAKEIKDAKKAGAKMGPMDLKQIVKNIGESIYANVSNRQFAKEIDHAMKASAKLPPALGQNSKAGAKMRRIVPSTKAPISAKATRKGYRIPAKSSLLGKKKKKKYPSRKGGSKRRKWFRPQRSRSRGRYGPRRRPVGRFRKRYRPRKRYYGRRRIRPSKRNKWTSWGSWSECSATCGDAGIMSRRRFCVVTPCVGEDRSKKKCHPKPKPCPTKVAPVGRLAEWGRWSPCSDTCGVGWKRQIRMCSTSKCNGPTTRTKTCVRESCNPLTVDQPKQVVHNGIVRLHCLYNHQAPVKKIYWVTPKGYHIYKSEANPRIKMKGDYLFIGRPSYADRGMYHCVIVRHNGLTDTSDALLEMLSCRNNDACLNGGVCIDFKHHWGYKCVCPNNYSGRHCENAETLVIWLIVLIVLFSVAGILLFVLLALYLRNSGGGPRRRWRFGRSKIPSITSCYEDKDTEVPEESKPLLGEEDTEEPKKKPDDAEGASMLPAHPGRNSEHIYETIHSDGSNPSLKHRPVSIDKDQISKLRCMSTPATSSPLDPSVKPPRFTSMITQKTYRDRSPLDRNKREAGDSGSSDSINRDRRITAKKVSFPDLQSGGILGSLSDNSYISLEPRPLEIDAVKLGEDSYLDISGTDLKTSDAEKTPEAKDAAEKENIKDTPVPKNWFARKVGGFVKKISPKKKSPEKEKEKEKEKVEADGGSIEEEGSSSMLEVAGIVTGIVTPPSSAEKSPEDRGIDSKPLSNQGSDSSSKAPRYKTSLEISPKISNLEMSFEDALEAQPEPLYMNVTPPGSSPRESQPDAKRGQQLYASWWRGGEIPIGPANMPRDALEEMEDELEARGLTPERSSNPVKRLFSYDENSNNANNKDDGSNSDDEDGFEKKLGEHNMQLVQPPTIIPQASDLIAKVHDHCVNKPVGQDSGGAEQNLIDFEDALQDGTPKK